jgi:hypothetical protein
MLSARILLRLSGFYIGATAAKSATGFDRLPWYESQGFAFMAAVHGALRVRRVLVHLPI